MEASSRDATPETGVPDAGVQDTGTGEDGGLWVNPAPCGVGEIGATFRGIPAYCQPTSDDGYYQCDELANRFMRDALQHPDLDNVVTDFASSICQHAATMPAYSVWGPGSGATAGRAPVSGDLIVYSGTPGHVAVIVGFSDVTDIAILQQNAGPSVASVGWDPAGAFFVAADAECWVHAESAPPAEPPGGPPCGCFAGDVDYCGLAIVDHQWWYGCTPQVPEGGVKYGSLYDCDDAGVFAEKAECPGLCITVNLLDAGGYCGE